MIWYIAGIALGFAALCYFGYALATATDGALLTFCVAVLCLWVGIAGTVKDLAPPLPPIPVSGPLTEAESAAYTGPVSAGTYLRFMNWSGQLCLADVASSTGTQTTQSGTTSDSVSGGFLFLGVAGFGGGHVSGTSAGTTQTLPYRAYEFAVINHAGQAVVLTFPATSLEFSELPAGQQPSVQFLFNSTVFYQKGADRTSIFTAGEDSMVSGSGPYGGDMGLVFANTPIGLLLGQWVIDVEVSVTPQQFSQLTNPQLPGIRAP